MKRRIMSFLLLACILLFNGCKANEHSGEGTNSSITNTNTAKLYNAVLDEFKYPAENPLLFCADEFGNIACIGRSAKEVLCYSADGRLYAALPLPESFSVYSLACDENSIYLLGKYAESNNLVIGEIIMFYCCDRNGFYFINYDGVFSDKQYCGLGELYAFCPIGDNVVAFPDT